MNVSLFVTNDDTETSVRLLSCSLVVLAARVPDAGIQLKFDMLVGHNSVWTWSYFSQSLSLQRLVVPEAAVTSGPWHGPQRVALGIGLPVRVVDAASTSKRAKAPLFWTVHTSLADGHLVGATRTGCSAWRRVSHSSRAVGVCPTPTTRDRSSVRP